MEQGPDTNRKHVHAHFKGKPPLTYAYLCHKNNKTKYNQQVCHIPHRLKRSMFILQVSATEQTRRYPRGGGGGEGGTAVLSTHQSITQSSYPGCVAGGTGVFWTKVSKSFKRSSNVEGGEVSGPKFLSPI